MTAARRNPTCVHPLVLPSGAVVSGPGAASKARSASRERGVRPVYFAGPENHLVARAIERLLAEPNQSAGRRLGPTTLIGPPGSGKSLLAKGVASGWAEACGPESVIALTGTDLRRRLEQAIASDCERPGSVTSLAQTLAGVRLLVVEDIEGLAASPSAVDLLTATLDRLSESQATLLVTASRPLGEIEGLHARLVSRLSAGTTLEVAAPAEGARQELLVTSFDAAGALLDPTAAADLAAWLPADARRVLAAAEKLLVRFGTQQPIGPKQVKSYISEASLDEASTPLAEIAAVVIRYYKMSLRELRSSSRKAPVVLARAVTIYLARQITPLSYDEIGRYLGGRDHTTVMHNYNGITKRMPTDRALRSAIDDLLRRLGRADLICPSGPLDDAKESA